MDLSFAELNISHSPSCLFSLLYLTGYLTKVGESEDGAILKIPNEEIKDCFKRQIEQYFSSPNQRTVEDGKLLFSALLKGDHAAAEQILNWYLKKYVSIRDAGSESHYHGFLLGLLAMGKPDRWTGVIESNQEAGSGYADITIDDAISSTAVLMELKRAPQATDAALEAACRAGLEQLSNRAYADKYSERRNIHQYAIAFSGKRCRVMSLK